MDTINFKSLEQIAPQGQKQITRSQEPGFADKLKESIVAVNKSQQNADHAMEKVIKGELGIHEGMLKIQEADISLRLLLQVRKKVMDAYTEIIRMQL